MPRPFHLAFFWLATVSVIYQVVCPYTKVEESFGLQAMHDLHYHGVTPAVTVAWRREADSTLLPYDHVQYPGVVPRSFVFPLLVAAASRVVTVTISPLLSVLSENNTSTPINPNVVQTLCRFIILCATLHGWYRLAAALQRRYAPAGTLLLLLTASQFHLPYYGSRPLPNTAALILCLHAWAAWFNGLGVYNNDSNRQHTNNNPHIRTAARLLIVATAVVRCDVLLLLATCGLGWLVTGQLRLLEAIRLGITTGALTLLLTVPLESLLWCTASSPTAPCYHGLLWPEGVVFYYNAILGKSENWGTSPWYWYLTSALPKALLGALFWLPWSMVGLNNKSGWHVDTTFLLPLFAFAGFVALYSCLGHKEVRFLFPALPLANALAAVGWAKWHRWAFPVKKDDGDAAKSSLSLSLWLKRAVYAAGCVLWVASTVTSAVFVAVSQQNYPGGVALQYLSSHVASNATTPCRVYIDNAAAMTGVSLFGQRSVPQCSFVKAGYEEEHQDLISTATMTDVTFLITDEGGLGDDDFVTIHTVSGHPRLNWRKVAIETSDALYVRRREQI